MAENLDVNLNKNCESHDLFCQRDTSEFESLGKLLIMNLIIDCSQLINLKFVFFWMAK